jgi:type II secretory pathway pseudopilin PulG
MIAARRLRGDAGTSLLELVVAIGVFLMLLVGVLSTLDSGTKAERHSQSKQDTIQDLRLAVARMTKDVRQAVAIQPTSTRGKLVFRTIVAGDEKNITYQVTAENDLYRLVEGVPPGIPLVSDVSNGTTIFCYDPPTCAMSNPVPPFTRIRISLAGLPEVGSQVPILFATDVELRNL